jgi:beta-lactamase class D
LSVAGRASAATTCTLVVDAATGATLVRVGDRCDERLTPASTFKIPLSLIGFDSGILRDANQPAWPYKDEYKTWNDEWKQTTTPRTWLRDSVVWYSQVLTRKLGDAKFQQYVDKLGYGNRDVSGGLTTAWLASSLRISAVEQAAFVRRMIRRELPVSPSAIDRTMAIMPVVAYQWQDGDWIPAAGGRHERSRSSGGMVRRMGSARGKNRRLCTADRG